MKKALLILITGVLSTPVSAQFSTPSELRREAEVRNQWLNELVVKSTMTNPCKGAGLSDSEFRVRFQSRTDVYARRDPWELYVPGYGTYYIVINHMAEGRADYICWKRREK